MSKVIALFPRGLQEAPPEGSAATHLELGLAYAEMGLFADAIAEIELALKADPGNTIGRAALELLRDARSLGSSTRIGRS